MSVVAAKIYKEKIVMAADSILVYGDTKINKNFSKIVKINDMIMGAVGSAQEASLMWHYMETHTPKSTQLRDILNYFVEFTKWREDIDKKTELENDYLFAYKGHLYNISCLFVNEIHDFSAIGAGMDYALAALYLDHTPKQAVKVACDLSCWVSEPIEQYEMKIDAQG